MYIWSYCAWFRDIDTVLFLISTEPFRNGSVFSCSTACMSAAIGVKMGKYGTVYFNLQIKHRSKNINGHVKSGEYSV